MFWPIMGLAHGLNQPFSQLVNHEVFSLAWAKSTVYATGVSGLHILTGKWGPWTLLRSLFSTFCNLHVVIGKFFMLNYQHFRILKNIQMG